MDPQPTVFELLRTGPSGITRATCKSAADALEACRLHEATLKPGDALRVESVAVVPGGTLSTVVTREALEALAHAEVSAATAPQFLSKL